MERELMEKDSEKSGLANQKDRQDAYIEELLDAIKERDRIIERAESDRDAFQEDVATLKKELEKVRYIHIARQRGRQRERPDQSLGREAGVCW